MKKDVLWPAILEILMIIIILIEKFIQLKCLELSFDIHDVLPSHLKQAFYKQSRFLRILSDYFLVTSIEVQDSTINIDFELSASVGGPEISIPKHVNIHRQYENTNWIRTILFINQHELVFSNASVLESF